MSEAATTRHDVHPASIGHLGLTVIDLDEAVAWYGTVFGLDPVAGPISVAAGAGAIGRQASDVFGPRLESFRQAHLIGGNGVTLELFQFTAPRSTRRQNNFEYWKTGPFHICMVERDIESAVERVERTGGRHRTARIWEAVPGTEFRMCYCEDPFGNIVEIHTHAPDIVFGSDQ